MNDSVLNKATNFLWQMFCLNCIFIASNIVLIIALLFVVFHWITLPLYLIALLFLIISLQAMLLTLKRIGSSDEVAVVRQYIWAYYETIKDLHIYALAYLGLAVTLGIGYINIRFIRTNQALFTSTYIILFILLYVHFVFGTLIQVHFVVNMKDTFKLGLYCIFKYPLYSLFIFIATVMVGWTVRIIPALLFLGIIPLLGYNITKITRKILEDLQLTLIDTKQEF